MASIECRMTQHGKRRYRVIIRRKGYPYIRRTFYNRREAEAWARSTEADLAAGRAPGAGASHTFADLVARYVAQVAPKVKTGNRTAQQLNAWAEDLGEIPLRELRPAHISEARDRLARTRGPATVRRYLSALSRALAVACADWQWIAENPARRVMWPREPRGRVRFLTNEERERLLAACVASPCPQLLPVVRLALLTGMRKGEILGLQWRHVDLARSRLILTETKNNERRQVPLVNPARRLIAAQDRSRLGAGPNNYVFHPARDPDSPLSLDRHWPAALAQAGINDFRFHDLRHTAASYLAMTGATTAVIAEVLGHKTAAMVKRYAHLTSTHTAEHLDRMATEYFPS